MKAGLWPTCSEPANSHDFLLCSDLHKRNYAHLAEESDAFSALALGEGGRSCGSLLNIILISSKGTRPTSTALFSDLCVAKVRPY